MLFELALNETESDICFSAVRVEATIIGFCVAFIEDRGVLTFCNSQIRTVTVVTHDERLGSAGLWRVGHRVAVYRYEDVGVVAVSDVGTLHQLDEDVSGTGVIDFHIRIFLFYVCAGFLGHGEGDVLLLRLLSDSARVLPAMPGVNDNGLNLGCLAVNLWR